jgi:histidinol-phosphate phosphatase family protein
MIPDDLDIQAVLIDRDGVVIRYVPGDYTRSADTVALIPGVADAIRRLNEIGIPVFVISNQQGVGKRLMTQEALDQVDIAMRAQLLDASGATITRSYYCTHVAADNCDCRKPKAGMILQAAQEFGFEPLRAIMIGDSPSDIAAGKRGGVALTVLVMTGATTFVPTGEIDAVLHPDYIARDLAAAVAALFGKSTDAAH